MEQLHERLSQPFDPANRESAVNTVIIGSGYGGSVLAARLAAALPRGSVAVLERGRELQPGQYPESFKEAVPELRSPNKPAGMFDFRFGRDMDVVISNVLGGGSLINAAVMMPPKAQVFDDNCWPPEINAQSITPYIKACLRNFSAIPTPRQKDSTNRLAAEKLQNLYDCAEDLNIKDYFKTLNVAINHQQFVDDYNLHGVRQLPCNHCGNCVTGCNRGSKNTLLSNYLPVAVNNGARLYTGIEVLTIGLSNRSDYRYRLRAKVYSAIDDGKTQAIVEIHCQRVFLAAGTLGSTELLLRARAANELALSDHLGRRFSGNGDSLVIVSGAPSSGMAGEPRKPGPCINGMLDFRTKQNTGFVIQDGAVPSALLKPVMAYLKARGFKATQEQTQVLLAMGYDQAEGLLKLDRKGHISIIWPDANKQASQRSIKDLFRQLARNWGGEAIANPRSAISVLGWHGATPVSAHPLGGCSMGASVDEGVTDSCGRVWNAENRKTYKGLYVMDGSVMPRSLGANPSLTIAALAERAAQEIIKNDLQADLIADRASSTEALHA